MQNILASFLYSETKCKHIYWCQFFRPSIKRDLKILQAETQRFDVFLYVIPAGFDTEGLSSAVWPGGETEALTRLERHLERKASQFFILNQNVNYLPLAMINARSLFGYISATLSNNMTQHHSVIPDHVMLPSGMGGQLRASQNERQLAPRQPDRPQPVPALWLPVLPPLLLQTHRPLQEGNGSELGATLIWSNTNFVHIPSYINMQPLH